MTRFATLTTAMATLVVSGQSIAAADRFQPTGYIQNHRGDKCRYAQRVDNNSSYFHTSLKGTMGVITFDDPRCMSEADVGLDVDR